MKTCWDILPEIKRQKVASKIFCKSPNKFYKIHHASALPNSNCKKPLNNRRYAVVVRASGLLSVDLGVHFPSRAKQPKKDLKKMVFTASMLRAQQIGIVWRTSRQACLFCGWARHSRGCLHLYVADRVWGQAVYPSWWPQSNWRFAN